MVRSAIIFAASLFISVSACDRTGTIPEKPNIVWITSEDNSVHYMDLYTEGGAPTPHISSLAESGLIYTHAFSNAPVCSAARSALITGCYGPRIGANYHRKMKIVPMPGNLEMFPAYLRRAGYYTTNNAKEDYNIIKGDSVWDESSRHATWRNRKDGQPFFHVFNIHSTHESRLHFTRQEMESYRTKTDPESFSVIPVHPDTELFRYTGAVYRDRIMEMDSIAGEVINKLREDGLFENTFIFYFGDHGGVLPGSKGYLYETGLHVPLVIHVPEKYRDLVAFETGSQVDGFVSFTDFAPTVLALAGIEIPEEIDGLPFLGKNVSKEEMENRNVTYGYADRFDEKYDMVRSVRKGDFKYIRSYQPFNFDGLMNNYRYIQLAYRQWQEMFREGSLDEVQARFFEPRPAEMMFNVVDDPYETKDLSGDPAYSEILEEMRSDLYNWVTGMPDLSFFPENVLISQAFGDPVTFGLQNKEKIRQYVETANLQLSGFQVAKPALLEALNSADPWIRYWALIVCSSYAEKDKDLLGRAGEISRTDPELLNRVRAAEYLAFTGAESPVEVMTRALYSSREPAEALLILNSMVLMKDGTPGVIFSIQPSMIPENIRNNSEVGRRLEYLL